MVLINVLVVNAFVVALGAGLLTGGVVSSSTEPENVSQATSNVTDLAGSASITPAKFTFPLADRQDKGPIVLPAVPNAKRIVISVTNVYPSSSGPFGVGVIPAITFDSFVPTSARWKIEERLDVEIDSKVNKETAWYWVDSQTLMLRPKDFWEPNTNVTIRSNWPTKKPIVRIIPSDWNKKKAVPTKKMIDIRMANDVSMDFTIGRSQILTIDARNHSGVVERKGKEVRRVPVSLGKSEWETASGVKTLMEFYRVKRLSNTTGPETWDVEAPYSIRLTWSGEFLHSASWNPLIGSANTSHGCTNLTMSDAQWFYENGLRGDPVITKNTGVGPVEAWDGDGAPWNISWKTWSGSQHVVP